MDWVTAVVGAASAVIGSFLTWLAARRQAEVSQFEADTKEREIYLNSLESLVGILRSQIDAYLKRIRELEEEVSALRQQVFDLTEKLEASERKIAALQYQLRMQGGPGGNSL